MNAQDLEQQARRLLAAGYERSNCKQVADWVISQPFDEMDVRHQIALDAIAAALRQQPAPVVDEATRKLIAEISLRFKSGNSVPVERAHIRADEWAALTAAMSSVQGVQP